LIHNAIDTEDFRRRQERAAAKQKIGAPREGVLLGAMGRLSAEKGFDLLIDAVDGLLRNGENVFLWIAGKGNAHEELEARIRRLGREDRIRLLGHLPEPRDFLEAMDLFVLSSLREGLPNVVLEAMALEVPLVATRVAGIPSLIRDDENGILVEPGTVEVLTGGIRRLLADGETAARLARAARRTVEDSYAFTRRMEKMAAIYDRTLRSPPSFRRRLTSAKQP
jgi:glycosyltransferase involved in cell wall biosynthesis